MVPERASIGRSVAVAALAIVLLVSAASGAVAAQSFEGAGGSIVVEEGETYDSIDGVAGSIVIHGTVTGDVSGAAGTIHVSESGTVEGSIQGGAGTIRIEGEVGGDVQAGSGSVEVTDTARIGGSLDAGGSMVTVDGQVDGDVRAGAETVELGPNAVVGGEFRYDAQNFNRADGATVEGGVVQDSELGGGGAGFDGVPAWLSIAYSFLANLLLGVILLAVFPRFSSGVAGRIADDPLRTGGVGLLALIAVPVVLLLVAFTVIGIPLTVIGAVGYAMAIWIGLVYGRYAVAAWALSLAGVDNRWLALVVGLAAFAVLQAIPWIGGLLDFLVLLLGLGALSRGLWDAYQARDGRTGDRQATLDEVDEDAAAS